MSLLYEGGDSCFINYLSHSINGKCVQNMFKVLKKKKIHYEILNNAVSESMVLGHGFVIIFVCV